MEKGKLGSKPRSALSLAGLILGILSVGLFFIPIVRPILSILAIIFGAIAVARRQKFGLAGLLLGIISWIIWGIIFAIALSSGISELESAFEDFDEAEFEAAFEEALGELEDLDLEGLE